MPMLVPTSSGWPSKRIGASSAAMIWRAVAAKSRFAFMPHQDGEFVTAQARDTFGVFHRVLQARAHFTQHMIAHAVSERVVDVLEAVEVHHEDGELESAVACLRDGALQLVGEARAIGEIGERIFIGQFENAFLAIGDAAAHVIQAGSEHADLVAAPHVDRRVVVTFFDARRRAGEGLERPRDIARDRDAADDGEHEA